MAWGTITIGGFPLRETVSADYSRGALTISGQESSPPSRDAYVYAAHRNIAGLGRQAGLAVPVVFSDKPDLTGFYEVVDATSELVNLHQGEQVEANWTLALNRIGGGRDVEIESKIPKLARLTEAGLTGIPAAVYWHAAAAGHRTYYTGSTVPVVVPRIGTDGIVNVYTALPAGVPPRWTIDVEDFHDGGCRLSFDGYRHLGTDSPDLAVWEVHNGLARLRPGPSGGFTIDAYDPELTDWASSKDFSVTVNGSPITVNPTLTVLANDPAEVRLRLTYGLTPGRIELDLSLRRGSRFVNGVLKRHSAATLGIARQAAETAVTTPGGLRAAAVDGAGNRFVMGSSRVITTTLPTASISKSAMLKLDFFVGHEIGLTPQAGDAFADLFAQYLAAAGESTRVLTR